MAGSSEIPLLMNENFSPVSEPEMIASLESSKDGSEEFPILPREAWKSKLAYLKAILKAKQALDRIEKAAN
jgi:hypothetical protein